MVNGLMAWIMQAIHLINFLTFFYKGDKLCDYLFAL